MPSLIDSKIANCKSWADFEQLIAAHEKTKDRGDLFERLTQLFLQTSTTYSSKIKHVWWCNNPYTNEFPEAVRQKLNLPVEDEGIDLICETFEGKYWSVQAKYRTDNDKALTTKELSKFLSLSFVTSGQIELGLITHTSTKPVRKQDLMGRTTELGLQNFLEMSPEQWEQISNICKNNAPKPPLKRKPRPFQETAITRAVKHFQDEGNSRGKLIMPCGTGKSLMAYWIARQLDAKKIILAVPSLALVKQSLRDWTAEFLAEGIRPEWLAVCSDDSVGSMKEADSTLSTIYETGIPTTTDPKAIADFLNRTSDTQKVIFTTYQSGQKLADVCRNTNFEADLLIADEAHKTVGSKNKSFASLLSEENISISKRLFMTATERVVRAADKDVASMDDVDVYGDVFHQMTFKSAIDEGVICDYKILTLFVSEAEVAELIGDKASTISNSRGSNKQSDATSLAVGVAVEKAFKNYGIRRAISFHSSIKRAENFASQQEEFRGFFQGGNRIQYSTVSSKLSAGQRHSRLNRFAEADYSLIGNARCLTEGVDIPGVDCVIFADPKKSVVDIVQAAGRAMRLSPKTQKEFGYILLPIIVPEDKSIDEVCETSEFNAISRVISALATQDERVVEELKLRESKGNTGILRFNAEFPITKNIDPDKFYNSISTQIWSVVGRANFLPFDEAREFVRSQNIASQTAWNRWVKDGNKPPDIPSAPSAHYKSSGWVSWGDWLGTDAVASQLFEYRGFEEARHFARSLGLNSLKEWIEFARSESCPDDIPVNIYQTYSDQGWKGVGDFLGTGRISPKDREYLSFEEARKYMRSLGLKGSKDWSDWKKSGQRPDNIPGDPHKRYANEGWKGIGDFLGTGKKHWSEIEYLPFEEAREYMRSLGLKTYAEWSQWKKDGKRPENIPSSPHSFYKNSGWKGLEDFLGSRDIPYHQREWRSFEDAREFVRSLNLIGHDGWKKWAASDQRPRDIPSTPSKAYKDQGWKGLPDFLGNEAWTRSNEYMSFEEARDYAHKLGLDNSKEWIAWANSAKRPESMPKYPNYKYKKDGWVSWKDFLGSKGGRPARSQEYLPYEDARKFARSLNLKSGREWFEYAKSGLKPDNIPTNIGQAYRGKGWTGMGDFLGIEISRNTEYLPFEEAKAFMRKQGLKNYKEWNEWQKSKKRPKNIPRNPHDIYADSGWQGLSDYIGGKNKSWKDRQWRSFTEAKSYAKGLKLRSSRYWRDMAKDGQLPDDIPKNPDTAYKKTGWVSWADFLGTTNVRPIDIPTLPFEEARKFARSLNISSRSDWLAWAKGDQRPQNIPANPLRAYSEKGWIGWSDWLGAKGASASDTVFLSFEEARDKARSLKLNSRKEWSEQDWGLEQMEGLPRSPSDVYRKKGWQGWGDFLGTGYERNKNFLSFAKAREYARALGFKGRAEWNLWAKTNARPDNMPSNPPQSYKDKGWNGWGDFLGTGNIRPGSKWQREEDPET